jgi:predicted Zn-dependent protease
MWDDSSQANPESAQRELHF